MRFDYAGGKKRGDGEGRRRRGVFSVPSQNLTQSHTDFADFFRTENASRGAPQAGIDSALKGSQDALARHLGYLRDQHTSQAMFDERNRQAQRDWLESVYGNDWREVLFGGGYDDSFDWNNGDRLRNYLRPPTFWDTAGAMFRWSLTPPSERRGGPFGGGIR